MESSHSSQVSEKVFERQRLEMVQTQIEARGVKDNQVSGAMKRIPRHLFVEDRIKSEAYKDRPLPIGQNQTISQPYIVAFMSAAAEISPNDRVLEVGTGCGYQTALLAELAKNVYSIEIIKELHEQASSLLSQLGYRNISLRLGNGYQGWPEEAPFDVILATAAPPKIPEALITQLAEGGRFITPVGQNYQELVKIRKIKGTPLKETLIPVQFVPMVADSDAGKN